MVKRKQCPSKIMLNNRKVKKKNFFIELFFLLNTHIHLIFPQQPIIFSNSSTKSPLLYIPIVKDNKKSIIKKEKRNKEREKKIERKRV